MNNLLKNWDAARFVRLATGMGVGTYALVAKDYLWLWLAGILLLQAVLNLSCCGAGGCGAGNRTSQKPLYRDEIETYDPKNKPKKE
jgi:hypothetical protein